MDRDAERFVIDSACHGSEQAWRQLFAWHFEPVYRFCLALTAGRRALAEEVSQEVFVTAARRLCQFRSQQGTFRGWLHGIARNRYLTLEAKAQRRRHHEALPHRPDGRAARRSQPDILVHEVLARLPSEYRRALEDKYLRRLTMKEMAAADGRSIEAIESLLRRARDRFAPIYESLQKER